MAARNYSFSSSSTSSSLPSSPNPVPLARSHLRSPRPTSFSSPDLDPQTYKLETKISKKHVVHKRSVNEPARWWELGLGGTEKWERVKKIGVGAYGAVYLEKEKKTQQLRAVKKISTQLLGSQGFDIKRELHALISIRDHQDLFVQFFGWYEDEAEEFTFIAMEYVEYGDLGKYLKDFGPKAKLHAKEITAQLLDGLAILHERNICHRDLKPQVRPLLPRKRKRGKLSTSSHVLKKLQNVLIACLSPIHVKLADFGVSKSTIGTQLRTRCGTHGYLAPELLGFVSLKGSEYSKAVDMWSLGCLVHEILTLELPFSERMSHDDMTETTISGITAASTIEPDMELFFQFCAGKIDLPMESLQKSQASDCEIEFVKGLLIAPPKSRMSAKDGLNHRWMFAFPNAFLPENSPETIRARLASLKPPLSPRTINELVVVFRQRSNVNIQKLIQSNGIDALIYKAATNGFAPVLEMLISLLSTNIKVYINMKVLGWSVLQAAARGGHTGAVRVLLAEGAEVNTEPARDRGRTALQAAAEGGHLDVVKLLLQSGAEVNAEPAWGRGRTALQAAAAGGHLDVLKLLLQSGAEVNAKPAWDSGRTALQAAAEGGHLDVVKLLLQSGAKVNVEPAKYSGRTALQAAAAGGHLDVLKLLLQSGAEVNAKPAEHSGLTALQAAAAGGHLDVVKLLLQSGAGVNAKPAEYSGLTALQAAAAGGHLDVLKLLLQSGAEVNAEPAWDSGRTALQAAAAGGHLDAVKLLLQSGAEVNAKPAWDSGRTALQAAAEGGHLDVVKLLLQSGAGVNAETAVLYGRTALRAATTGGHLDVMKLLEENGAI